MTGFNRLTSLFFVFSLMVGCGNAQFVIKKVEYHHIITGAQQVEQYLPLIRNKSVALVANHASILGHVHLADSLLNLNVNLHKIFCPEHGFRGTSDAGELIDDGKDPILGIPIVSLYGKHKKPTPEDLKGVELVLFDLQDVGVRFYTYISTMTYVMEACAENNIPIVIMDRPNPNGFLIDGPILDSNYRSFVGLHPVPIAYGMTIGEYALMIQGEKWISNAEQLDLKIIPLKNYEHNLLVELAIKPSPNLPNWQSVYLYPSLCLFEGTQVSIGRGTLFPFQVYGSPGMSLGSFSFTPQSIPGMSSHPKFEGEPCFGQNLSGYAENFAHNPIKIQLNWLISSYQMASKKEHFFNSYFEKLAGTHKLREQIEQGWKEDDIRNSWKPGLETFKETRKKYLLYP
jgi:uncharacterized protein YbbC (DUF1343 family)